MKRLMKVGFIFDDDGFVGGLLLDYLIKGSLRLGNEVYTGRNDFDMVYELERVVKEEE